MDIPGLLKSQIADLGREVANAGFRASDFAHETLAYERSGQTPAEALRHRQSRGFFAFGRAYTRNYGYGPKGRGGDFRVGFSPGAESNVDDRNELDWHGVLAAFREWLGYIRRESTAPDFWDAVAAHSSDPGEGPRTGEDDSFDETERESVGKRLGQIEEMLFAMAKQQGADHEFIAAEFADLRTELATMKRGKWKKLVLGTLADLAIKEVLSPDNIRKAVDAASDFLTNDLP